MYVTAESAAWSLGKLGVKTRAAGTNRSGRGRANTSLSRLLNAVPPTKENKRKSAYFQLRTARKYPVATSSTRPSTAKLPNEVTSRADSCTHGGPIGVAKLLEL